MSSFKAIAVKKSLAHQSIQDVIFDMYYQLIHLGVDHEVNTHRIDLPRQILYQKDEETGEAYQLTQLEERLDERLHRKYASRVLLSGLTTVPSYVSPHIQIADLFAAGIARKLNFLNSSTHNHKDELSDYIWDFLEINKIKFHINMLSDENHQSNNENDMSVLYIFE